MILRSLFSVALATVLYAPCITADQLPAEDLFGTGRSEWYLAFRGTAYIEKPVYDAYLHGSDNVDAGCKQPVSQNLPCSDHYRSSILDNWKDIEEVAFVVFKYQSVQAYAIFDGEHTDNLNWFRAANLKSSSWPSLTGNPQFFSILGDSSLSRRFFINHNYNGCDKDAGWFVAVDRHAQSKLCAWEMEEAYPFFIYATDDSFENWNTGRFSEADSIGVYVKYRQPEMIDFQDLFGTGRKEWRIVFRGTSHINIPVYDAYVHGSQNVADACKQTDGRVPCPSHYRSSILDDWKDIAEVAFVIYNNGVMQKYALFDGTGTDSMNWFGIDKLRRSSWTDLQGHPHYFSIAGHSELKRRFFINFQYGGCPKDAGWFVAVDQHSKPCKWETVTSYPLFLFSNSNTHENWNTGNFAEADVIAVFVKFGVASPVVG